MSLLAVLSLYMYVLFRRERREAMAYAAESGGASHGQADSHGHAGHDSHGHGDHGHADHGHAPAAHHAQAHAAPAKKKASLKWRTAWLWLPIVAGFGAQAYHDFGGPAYYQETIKPMLEKSAG